MLLLLLLKAFHAREQRAPPPARDLERESPSERVAGEGWPVIGRVGVAELHRGRVGVGHGPGEEEHHAEGQRRVLKPG